MIFKLSAFADGTDDIEFSVSSLQTDSTTDNLGKLSPYNYASLELDSYDVDNPRPLYKSQGLALSTSEQSDEKGNFTNPIEIIIYINNVIDFSGISISADCIITNAVINTYDADGKLVDGKAFYNSESTNYFKTVSRMVSEVTILIHSISEPNRFLDIFSIDFGKVFSFGEDTIKEPKMVNEISLSGRELPIDTLDFTLLNIPDDLLLDYNQKLEVVNDNGITEYTFYLETFNESEDNESIKISLTDCVDLLEDKTFEGGYYANKILRELVAEILEDTDLFCEMDEGIANTLVAGYIPVTSKRNAFIYVANATGYKISKHPNLKIFNPRDYDYASFDDGNVFLGTIKKTTGKPSKKIDLSVFTYEKTSDGYKSSTEIKTTEIKNAELYKNFAVQTIDNFTLMQDAYDLDSHSYVSGYQLRLKQLLNYYSVNETTSAKVLWDKPQIGSYIRFYGSRKQIKKITTSFTEAVEIEVEAVVD